MLTHLTRMFNTKSELRRRIRRRQLRQSLEQLEQRQLLAADLNYSTFLPSTDQEDGIVAIAQDTSGNAFVAEYSYDALTYEVSASVSKLSPSGQLQWTQELDEYFHDIAVDDHGRVFLVTSTSQDGLPTTTDAFQDTLAGGTDFYVLVLNSNAIDSDPTSLSANELVYASYLGGTAGEGQTFVSIATNSNGDIAVAGETTSTDFPVTLQPEVDTSLDGSSDGFVAYFSPSSGSYTLELSTYLGGSGSDSIRGMDVANDGTLHVVGKTASADYPLTANAIQTDRPLAGQINAGFLTRLNPSGELAFSTLFGGDIVYDVAADAFGNSHVIGGGGREGFPTTPGAYAPDEIFSEDGVSRLRGNFASKISATGDLEYSSWFQLSEDVLQISGASIVLDQDRPVIAGYDDSGPQRSSFFVRFASDYSGLLDTTVVDGDVDLYSWITVSDVVDGSFYVGGFTESGSFVTTSDAIHPTKNIGTDGYARRYTFAEELPPTINPKTVTLEPTIAAGSAFAVIEAEASSPEHSLTYAITAGAGAFSIDATSGKVSILDPSVLDFQTYQPTTLVVSVSDSQSPPQSNSATLTIYPFEPSTLAEDTFDSRTFDRGEGWIESAWETSNYTYIVDGYNDDGHNYAGTMLQNDKGLLQRSFDTTGFDTLSLSYWTKLKSLESGDRGLVQVSSDGVHWQTVHSHENGEDDDTWRNHEIEFSTPGDRTYIRFDAAMSQSGRWWRPNHDYWYIDEIIVQGTSLDNGAPETLPDSFTTEENSTLSISGAGLLANDADVDGDSLSALLVTQPNHGAVNLQNDGGFTYTPNSNFSGVDTFSYRASDGQLQSAVTTVTIMVTDLPDNDPPVANDDAFTVSEDNTLNVSATGVLDNDTDPEGQTLNAALASGPNHGTLSLNPDGSFVYTPNSDFNGTDEFTYFANDGVIDSAPASVTIFVTPVNDAPQATDDNYDLDQDEVLSISAAQGVLDNDSDFDGDTLSAILASGPTHGSVNLHADGSFEYTPNPGFSGSDSFTYQAQDPSQATSGIVTVSLTVEPVAAGPNLTHGVVSNVTDSWETVPFGTSYDSPIVIATPQYDVGSGPGVSRIRNITATSFEVRVDNVGSSAFSGGVHFVALEEGIYNEPGFKLEARRLDTNVTSRRGGWSVDTVNYQQSYSSPVVVGQVMSANDEDWSVFWSSSSSRTSPANSSSLNVGKHVGEDSDKTRSAETLGFIVIEATQDGAIEGLPFVAGVGSDTIRGVGNGTSQYSYDAMPNAKTAVLSAAGMDGNDGGWPVLMGSNALPASSGTINLAFDEDQLRDGERNHTTEQVAYFVIDPPMNTMFSAAEVENDADVVAFNSLDVNGDGLTTPIDALQLINHLNQTSKKVTPLEEHDLALDTNRDGHLSPLDALLVINHLNAAEAEPESSPEPSSKFTPEHFDGYFADLESEKKFRWF